MSEGLRPHYHQYYIYGIKKYFNHQKGCMVKDATFRCMICGKEHHERYEYKPPPSKEKNKNKVLEKNKRKHNDRK